MKLPLSDGTSREIPHVTLIKPFVPQFAAQYKSPAKETIRRTILKQVADWLEHTASAWAGAEIAAYIRRLE